MIKLVLNPKTQSVEFTADEDREITGKYSCSNIQWAAFHILDALEKTGEYSIVINFINTANHEPYIAKMKNRLQRIIKKATKIQKTNNIFDVKDVKWSHDDSYTSVVLVNRS